MSSEHPPEEDHRFLVPVERSSTLRNTVAHVMERAIERAADDADVAVHFVYVLVHERDGFGAADEVRTAESLLDRAASWAELDLSASGTDAVSVETAMVAEDRLVFGPAEYADVLFEYASENELDRIVLDPGYNPGGAGSLLQPLEFELTRTGMIVEEAPVGRPARRTRLRRRLTTTRFVAVFGMSAGLYFILGDPTETFDLLTGMLTALVTAVALSTITFDREPTVRRTPLRLARGLIFVPYLFVEILKANVAVAAVILHPKLPIEPRMTRMRCRVAPGMPVTTLANSITLTPGTLTVRARNQDLYVHTLLPSSRADLFDGRLERWVRFVFGGRSAARGITPRERDDIAVLQGPEADEPLFPHQVSSESTEPSGDGDHAGGASP